jgi:hypothetical protein
VHGRNFVASGSGVKQQWRDIGHANAPQQIFVIPGCALRHSGAPRSGEPANPDLISEISGSAPSRIPE